MGNLLAIAEFSGSAAEDHALATTREMFHLGLSKRKGRGKRNDAITFLQLTVMLHSLPEPNLTTFVKLLMTFVRNGEKAKLCTEENGW